MRIAAGRFNDPICALAQSVSCATSPVSRTRRWTHGTPSPCRSTQQTVSQSECQDCIHTHGSDRDGHLPGWHHLDGGLFLHKFEAPATRQFRRLRTVWTPVGCAAMDHVDPKPCDLRTSVADLLDRDRFPARGP